MEGIVLNCVEILIGNQDMENLQDMEAQRHTQYNVKS